jgi:uncharacterized protein (TIGR02466 family)
MELIDQFTTKIHGTILQNVDLSLSDKILEFKKTNPSVSKSNEGGWQSEVFNWDQHEWLTPLMSQIKEEIEPLFQEYGSTNTGLFKYWINVNEPTNSNARHRHSGCILSGVVYLKVPENSGNIIFYRENLYYGILHTINENNRPIMQLTPIENGLLMFPAFLEHEVTPNLSNKTRISIAFNVT